MTLTLRQTARLMKGTIENGLPSSTAAGYSIDTRTIQPDELFFAIVSARDGHDFVQTAAIKGALGAVVSRKIAPPTSDFALIQVHNTLLALQDLARGVRRDSAAQVVGITGSIGKTTTRAFAASLLSLRYRVLQSEGNLNNHLGVPLMLLRLNPTHEVAVLELAMSRAGEIARLTQIVEPDIAVVTNVYPVHLEFFRSIEEIAAAKMEILKEMKTGGIAVLNGDDPRVEAMSHQARGPVIRFGLSDACDIRAADVQPTPERGLRCLLRYGGLEEPVNLPFVYTSYLSNFLAACAVGYALGLELSAVLETAPTLLPLSNRGRMYSLKCGLILVDDSYNSSPAALDSALRSLGGFQAPRKIAVLGDMLELGENGARFHEEAGRTTAETGWDMLVTVGPLARHIAGGAVNAGLPGKQVLSFETAEEAGPHIQSLLKEGDLILVKGSRGVKLETIVEIIKRKDD
ncbi:MAG: UDP-N-acetylmuramoyl-tripeptide--D-alanyl-D-alanine ligase [Acidobacteria bacterium]|nr:UDP-N-acetylmuramoyl-tripeptide--D-alanyl-D-alanine ligase [Acidobacteriota bacterium]MBU4495332.1 UDP-N-acetylmuramoyl-tripeptide--D-alanyl-D-alanine ligase [Acidobacteriota bacterium]